MINKCYPIFSTNEIDIKNDHQVRVCVCVFFLIVGTKKFICT